MAVLCGLITLALGSGDTLWAQYSQCSQATIGEIVHVTERPPTPTDRTNIGLGEKVACSILENTWDDWDTDDSTGQPVEDSLGSVTWSVGEGGKGSVDSPTGLTTTLTAHRSPGSVTVWVRAYDSREKYDDESADESVTFTVTAPNEIAFSDGVTTGTWTDSGSDNNIGVWTEFQYVISPTTVNFSLVNVPFAEKFEDPQDTKEWPNGDTHYGVAPGIIPYNSTPVDNLGTDEFRDGLYNKIKLNTVYPGAGWQNPGSWDTFYFSEPIMEMYKNQDNEWTQFATSSTMVDFKNASTLGEGRHTAGGEVGPYMGPWD